MTNEQIKRITQTIMHRLVEGSDLLHGDEGPYGEEYEMVYGVIFDVLNESSQTF